MLLVYKPSHRQEIPHFSSADVRKETRNGVLSCGVFEKEQKKQIYNIYIYIYIYIYTHRSNKRSLVNITTRSFRPL